MLKLEAKNLACCRGDKILFRKLSFELGAGQLLLVQGHNGAGKSSLLRIIAGLSTPDKGELYWHDKPTQQYASMMSYLGHKDGLKRALTGSENILYRLTLGEAEVTSHEFDKVIKELNLSSFINRPCYQLSMGERRRIALAGVILQKKPFWILDEPFASLDVKSSQRLQQSVNEHVMSGGMVMMASHVVWGNHHQVLNLSDCSH